MSLYLCHVEPDVFNFQARILERRADAVRLDRSLFYPGGGGQLADRGVLRWSDGEAKVTNIETIDGHVWHYLEGSQLPEGEVTGVIDQSFRLVMSQLHTDLHILNALVFQRFAGALVTGAQIAEDGTARVDFDLPEVDNDDLRALEPELNAVILSGLAIRETFLHSDEAVREPGLIRSRSVAPPRQEDDMVRIIEIEGLDRQACGGTHLTLTSQSAPVQILKVENKGKRNRRIRIGLVK